MPGAVWQGEHGSVLMKKYDIVCVHTIVGYAPAHAAHFSTKADGTILQSRDTMYQSGANLDGNYRVIAIENEDHGSAFPTWSGSNVPYLTPQQVTANARILIWAHQQHGVPLQLCPDSRPGSRGLAYHRQGIDGDFSAYKYPGRVSGGEVWTSKPGKVCPGDRRISQLPDILAQAGDDDLPTPADVWNFPVKNALKPEGSNMDPAHQLLTFAHSAATQAVQMIETLSNAVMHLPDAVWDAEVYEQVNEVNLQARQLLNGAHYYGYETYTALVAPAADEPPEG
jgi:hypothetical protein